MEIFCPFSSSYITKGTISKHFIKHKWLLTNETCQGVASNSITTCPFRCTISLNFWLLWFLQLTKLINLSISLYIVHWLAHVWHICMTKNNLQHGVNFNCKFVTLHIIKIVVVGIICRNGWIKVKLGYQECRWPYDINKVVSDSMLGYNWYLQHIQKI